MATRVLLDTDIGSDIDDAVCLAYLLAQKKCDLLGITTVTGEATRRASLASALCKVAGKEIPIHPGVEEPLLIPQRQPTAPQAAALRRWEHEQEFPQGRAIEFQRRMIREYPGEVVLLAIGPLTNVALLFAFDPEIPSLLRSLVIMGGGFDADDPRKAGVEWNAGGDPHATGIVFRRRANAHRTVGYDITQQVQMSADEVRERFKAPLLRPVLDFAESWFAHTDKITFHDPLAAATLFDDTICTFARGTVEVELTDGPGQGRTIFKPGDDGPHEVATSVDRDRFFEHYFSVL